MMQPSNLIPFLSSSPQVSLYLFLMLDINNFNQLKFICINLNKIVNNLEKKHITQSALDALSDEQKPFFLNENVGVYKKIVTDRYYLKSRVTNKIRRSKKNVFYYSSISSFLGLTVDTDTYTVFNRSFQIEKACDALLADDANNFIDQVSIFAPMLALIVSDNIHYTDKIKKSVSKFCNTYESQERIIGDRHLSFVRFFFTDMINVRAENCFRNCLNIYFFVLLTTHLFKTNSEYYQNEIQYFSQTLLDFKDDYFTNEFLLILAKHNQFKTLNWMLDKLFTESTSSQKTICTNRMAENKRQQMIAILEKADHYDTLWSFYTSFSEKNLVLAFAQLKTILSETLSDINLNVKANKLAEMQTNINKHFVAMANALQSISEEKPPQADYKK